MGGSSLSSDQYDDGGGLIGESAWRKLGLETRNHGRALQLHNQRSNLSSIPGGHCHAVGQGER